MSTDNTFIEPVWDLLEKIKPFDPRKAKKF